MTVYVDYLRIVESREPQAYRVGKRNGHHWCHLWADTPQELIDFGLSIGMRIGWLRGHKQRPHFDLVPSRRVRAIARGAVEMEYSEWYRENVIKPRGPVC